MATKNNPGDYDCYAKLEPDEPFFLLKSTDITAPYFVRAWRYVRAGLLDQAAEEMKKAQDAFFREAFRPGLPLSAPKSVEAGKCAEAMENWYKDKSK